MSYFSRMVIMRLVAVVFSQTRLSPFRGTKCIDKCIKTRCVSFQEHLCFQAFKHTQHQHTHTRKCAKRIWTKPQNMPLTQPQNDGQRNMEAAPNQRAKFKVNEEKKRRFKRAVHILLKTCILVIIVYIAAMLRVNSIMIVFVLL